MKMNTAFFSFNQNIAQNRQINIFRCNVTDDGQALYQVLLCARELHIQVVYFPVIRIIFY